MATRSARNAATVSLRSSRSSTRSAWVSLITLIGCVSEDDNHATHTAWRQSRPQPGIPLLWCHDSLRRGTHGGTGSGLSLVLSSSTCCPRR
jgi:hypothetical protein